MPWRNEAVEAALVGQEPTDAAFHAAADTLLADAKRAMARTTSRFR
jgi:xanthine dehydrogenase YagS FAD-binding subunit